MGDWAHEPVEVDLWTVLMAIRYGTGRLTYADVDASNLAQEYWDKFPPDIQKQIRQDATHFDSGRLGKNWEWLNTVDQRKKA